MKKIGLLCLCLTSLSLAGCFHVPDEYWLPSKDHVDTGNIEKNGDVEQAIDSFIEGIDIISSERSEMNSDESNEVDTNETGDEIIIEMDETVNNEESIENEDIVGNEYKEISVE